MMKIEWFFLVVTWERLNKVFFSTDTTPWDWSSTGLLLL